MSSAATGDGGEDSSAVVVERGEMSSAATGDGGEDGRVLLFCGPLTPSSPPAASTSLAIQALGRHSFRKALLASSFLGGGSVAGMVTVGVDKGLHHHLLHGLALALASASASPLPLALAVHRLHHPHRPLPRVKDAHGGLGHLALQLCGSRLPQAPVRVLLLQPVVEALHHGLQGFHVSGSHRGDLGSTGSNSLRPELGCTSLGRVQSSLAAEVHLR